MRLRCCCSSSSSLLLLAFAAVGILSVVSANGDADDAAEFNEIVQQALNVNKKLSDSLKCSKKSGTSSLFGRIITGNSANSKNSNNASVASCAFIQATTEQLNKALAEQSREAFDAAVAMAKARFDQTKKETETKLAALSSNGGTKAEFTVEAIQKRTENDLSVFLTNDDEEEGDTNAIAMEQLKAFMAQLAERKRILVKIHAKNNNNGKKGGVDIASADIVALDYQIILVAEKLHAIVTKQPTECAIISDDDVHQRRAKRALARDVRYMNLREFNLFNIADMAVATWEMVKVNAEWLLSLVIFPFSPFFYCARDSVHKWGVKRRIKMLAKMVKQLEELGVYVDCEVPTRY